MAVDGKPVRNRQERLASLFFTKRTGKLLERVINENARYNIGSIRRNFNVPMVPLLFLTGKNQPRFRFDRETNSGRQIPATLVVRYLETATPTFVLANGEHDSPSRGRYWIEPGTGRILATELSLSDDNTDIRIRVEYRMDERLGVLVPSVMHEMYDYPQRLDDMIECTARYSNFRRFETDTKIVIK